MKLLVITNLYPNKMEPVRGTYNRQQILSLSKLAEVKIVAPVACSPFSFFLNKKIFQIPYLESMDGIDVYHPKYFMIPKIGRSFYGIFFAFSIMKTILKIKKEYDFDAVYSPWVYPDGVGSYIISKIFKKTLLLGALGTDINLYMKYFWRRKMILHAINNSGGVVSVSTALKNAMIEYGAKENKISVILNGVDLGFFKIMDKQECRKKLNLNQQSKYILFIGNLVPVKGVSYLIDAFKKIVQNNNDLYLIIVGDGELRQKLVKKVQELDIADKVIFKGRKPHSEIPEWLNACDVFCLPSINEGCPNVILESMACGIPVVATNVGGIPELIQSEDYGIIVPSANFEKLADALQKALVLNWQRSKISNNPLIQSWHKNAEKLYDFLKSTLKF